MAAVSQAVEPNTPMNAPSSGIPHHALTNATPPHSSGPEVRYAVHNEYEQTAIDFLAVRG
jgi:hypothetical protein